MKKTLGGDRLGSGKKMTVELHNYERSTHDLSYIWRSTMSAGPLVPFLCEVGLPGDTFDINLDCVIKTHPTIGPLFGSYKTQLDVFSVPVRLYQGLLHNNKLGIGRNMANVKLPLIRLTNFPVDDPKDISNAQINPSCILAYLGIRGVGSSLLETGIAQTRDFNAIPILAYWDIYKNYYANKQEEIGVVINGIGTNNPNNVTAVTINGQALDEAPATEIPTIAMPPTSIVTISWPFGVWEPQFITFLTTIGYINGGEILTLTNTIAGGANYTYDGLKYGTLKVINWHNTPDNEIVVSPINLTTFPLADIDSMREGLLRTTVGNAPHIINVDAETSALTPYAYLSNNYHNLSSQQGLGVKTYNSDIFNNWLKTEWIDGPGGINEITAIDTSEGSFTIDTLNLSKKVYDMLNRIAVSGGSYDDWVDAVYTHDRFTRIETPVYHGGLIKELVFQEVVSNAEATSDNGTQPLGTLAGKGVMSNKHKGGKIVIKIDEPSYIIGIVSLTPRIDYSQGNRWDVNLKTMDDFHKPALDEIGFQELITEQMAWWSTNWITGTSTWEQQSAGKQPAWINYMTNYNRTYGNFAIESNEMFMTLNRRYEEEALGYGWKIKDLTTYIDPAKFNNIFAQTSLDSQNFWTQIGVDMFVRRKMSAKIMPNL